MSNYLSNIAERNVHPEQTMLHPTIAHHDAMDPKIEDLSPEINEAVNNEREISHDPPMSHSSDIQMIKPAANNEAGKKEDIENQSLYSYLNIHANRIEDVEKETVIKRPHTIIKDVLLENNIQQNIKEVPSQKMAEQPVNDIIPPEQKKMKPFKPKAEQDAVENEKPDTISPDKFNQKLQPSVTEIIHQHILKLSDGQKTFIPTTLKPHANEMELKQKNKIVVPKLSIGKIIVEILPTPKPAATKVINRVVQQNSTSNSSKINRLSFGLGQL